MFKEHFFNSYSRKLLKVVFPFFFLIYFSHFDSELMEKLVAEYLFFWMLRHLFKWMVLYWLEMEFICYQMVWFLSSCLYFFILKADTDSVIFNFDLENYIFDLVNYIFDLENYIFDLANCIFDPVNLIFDQVNFIFVQFFLILAQAFFLLSIYIIHFSNQVFVFTITHQVFFSSLFHNLIVFLAQKFLLNYLHHFLLFN